jgi:DNA-binding NtrC family response regulator
MKVLVVDDEQLVRWFLERALKKWGHNVTSVSNAKDALSEITSGNFDILFTDLRMPEESGTKILNSLESMQVERMKVVVCSAFITPELSQDFRNKGFLTLKKPFKLAELKSTLDMCS